MSIHIQTPGPDDPLVDYYTVDITSIDGQQLCESQTTGGMSTTLVLDVTGCVMCEGSNKSYAITVVASNLGGGTTANTSLCNTTSTLQCSFSVKVMAEF